MADVSYPIANNFEEGDPEHIEHHEILADSANDHEERLVSQGNRITTLEETEGVAAQPANGVWGVWDVVEFTGEPPAGTGWAARVDMGGGIFSMLFAAVDKNGASFDPLAFGIPIGSKVRVAETDNLIAGQTYTTTGAPNVMAGVLFSLLASVPSNPIWTVGNEIVALFSPASGVGGVTPDLAAVLEEGYRAGGLIILDLNDDVRVIYGNSNVRAIDDTVQTSGEIHPGSLKAADNDEASPEWGSIEVFPRRMWFTQQTVADSFVGALEPEELTESRDWSLPDASGTIALTDQLPEVITAAAYAALTPPVTGKIYVIQG